MIKTIDVKFDFSKFVTKDIKCKHSNLLELQIPVVASYMWDRER